MNSRSVSETTFLVFLEERDANTDKARGKWMQDISPLCYVLVVLFALPSQLATYGVAVEIPSLLRTLPEGLALPSYFTLVIQSGNMGPLALFFLYRFYPEKIKEWAVVASAVFTGGVSSLLMAFFWKETAYIFGAEHSAVFFPLLACMSFADGTASVLLWAYMGDFKSQYMSAFFVGQTFSRLFPAVVGLAQGTGQSRCVESNCTVLDGSTNTSQMTAVVIKKHQELRFSASVFFMTLFVLYVIGFVAFGFLEFARSCEDEKLCSVNTNVEPDFTEIRKKKKKKRKTRGRRVRENDLPLHLVKMTPSGFSTERYAELTESLRTIGASVELEHENQTNEITEAGKSSDVEAGDPDPTGRSDHTCSLPLVKLLTVCALIHVFGACVTPSLASYGCTPYGQQIYGLTITLMVIAGALGCVTALSFRDLSVAVTCALTIVAACLTAYVLVLNVKSPDPALHFDTVNDIVVVTCHLVATSLITFIMVSVAITLQKEGGRRALMWGGGCSQLGLSVGAVIAFLTAHFPKTFRDVKLQC